MYYDSANWECFSQTAPIGHLKKDSVLCDSSTICGAICVLTNTNLPTPAKGSAETKITTQKLK